MTPPAASTRWVEDHVPWQLAGAVYRQGLWDARPGALLLRFPGVGRVLLERDAPPVVRLAAQADAADVEALLDRPLAAAAAYLEGRVALRGSCVGAGDRAIVIIGLAGAGKSTLAAALTRAGHPLVADKVVTVDPATGLAHPGRPEIALSQAAAGLVGFEPSAGRRLRRGVGARGFPVAGEEQARPVSLVAWLGPPSVPGATRELGGLEKLLPLARSLWLAPVLQSLGVAEVAMRWVARTASATPVLMLLREAGERPDALADRLLGALP